MVSLGEAKIFNIFKECGKTSNQTLMEFRRKTGFKKSGFIGTLDPFANGVLPIAVNKATKQIESFLQKDKEYIFTLEFGKDTDSNDITGKIIAETSYIPSLKECQDAIQKYFIGEIYQSPPLYSAVKLNGKRMCDIARFEAATFDDTAINDILKSKEKIVHIKRFEIIEQIEARQLRCLVVCGKGTYIRKLAIDLARSVNSLAIVTSLTRTKVAESWIENSVKVENIPAEDLLSK